MSGTTYACRRSEGTADREGERKEECDKMSQIVVRRHDGKQIEVILVEASR